MRNWLKVFLFIALIPLAMTLDTLFILVSALSLEEPHGERVLDKLYLWLF